MVSVVRPTTKRRSTSSPALRRPPRSIVTTSPLERAVSFANPRSISIQTITKRNRSFIRVRRHEGADVHNSQERSQAGRQQSDLLVRLRWFQRLADARVL